MERKIKNRGSVITTLLFLVLVAIIGYLAVHWVLQTVWLSVSADDATGALKSLFIKACQMADKHYRMAGVRFQQTEAGEQYAIMIIQEPNMTRIEDTNDPNCIFVPFVRMASQPITKLGVKIAIISGYSISGEAVDTDDKVSVIFSPTGAPCKTWVMMKANPDLPSDRLYGSFGLFGEEFIGHPSSIAFYVYDKEELETSDNKEEFLRALMPVIVQPYVGARPR